MNFTNKKTALIKSISELKDADYSKVPELNGIYRRLSKGRKQFADIFDKKYKSSYADKFFGFDNETPNR